MPGAPIMHSFGTSTGPEGVGGSARVDTVVGHRPSGGPSHLTFFVWLLILGVILPAAILGGLNYAGFQFLFRHR